MEIKTYIVHFEDIDTNCDDLQIYLAVVKAATEEEAIRRFAENYISNNDDFKNHIEEKTINMSFAKKFCMPFYNEYGEIKKGFSRLDVSEGIAGNIRAYFNDDKMSDTFIDFFFDENKTSLPFEFLVDCLLKDEDWSGKIIAEPIENFML